MAEKKTIQAQKVSATWTPNAASARAIEGALEQFPAGVRIAGGKIRFAAALVAKYDDAALMQKNADWMARLKSDLSETGELHSWDVTAGAVPKGEVLDPFGTAVETVSEPVEQGEAA